MLISNSEQTGVVESPTKQKWDCSIITGTINPSASKKVKWETEESQESSDTSGLKEKMQEHTPSNGFVLLTETGNFVFALQFEKKPDDNKINFAFIQMGEAEKTVKFADLEVKEDGCTFNLFTWKEKIMLAKHSDGSSSMYELQTDKTKWVNTDEPISFLLHNLKDKSNFTAATIDNVSVLLFTQKLNSCTNGKKNCINMWITDGLRLFDVGTIVTDGDKVTFAGLLYINEKLFSLHKQAGEGQKPKSIVFTHLDKELKEINVILKKWKDSNKKIQQLYKDNATGATLFSTDRLVGLLFGTDKDGNRKWMNGYFNVDATMQEDSAKKQEIENGFKFCGEGVGAKWQTEQKEKKQLYNFINSGFTLVATVTIEKNTNTKNNSILGVVLTGVPKKSVGLWCTTGGKWGVSGVSDQPGIQPSTVDCTPDKINYIAVILNNDKKLSVYVNGQKLSKSQSEAIEITISENIEYFYFGAGSDTKTSSNTESHVTITNILLYNRPFDVSAIEKLKQETTEAKTQVISQANDKGIPEPHGGTTNSERPLPPPDTEIATENGKEAQSSSPPPTTGDSAVRVGVVGLLCFMLFGVFTLLGRYVY